MERSENINELATALSKAQGVIVPASKDSDNPFFKSKYADLAAVWEVARDPLHKNGLAVVQHPSAEGNVVTVETVLTHASGQWMASKLTMNAKDASPQAIGSCITYLRRYALSSVVGIASEIDDDGNAATHKEAPKSVREPKDIVYNPPVTMKSILVGEAKKKFPDMTAFQVWRVDNGFAEDLNELVDAKGNENGIEFAKLIRAVQEMKVA